MLIGETSSAPEDADEHEKAAEDLHEAQGIRGE